MGRTALGRTRHWAARHWAARHWAARHWAEIFPGRGRFGTLLSHPALLLATGNRGLGLMQAALQTAQQAAQAAQQAAEQAAAQTAEHKREIHELKVELTAVKDKMATMKQAGAPRPGEPHPPPKWQPDSEMPLNREQKLLSSLVAQLRGGVVDGRATQSQLVGKLGHVTDKLDQIAARLSFLEQQQSRARTGGSSRSLSTSRGSQQGKSPVFFAGATTTGLVSAAGGAVGDVFAQLPKWPPPGVSTDWTSPKGSKVTDTSSPFQFSPSATGAAKIVTVPFGALAPAPQPDSKSETDEEEGEEKDDGVSDYCHFSDGEEEDEVEPEGVLQVTTRLDSGGTTPKKVRPVPVPNIRACSKSPPVKFKIKRHISPGDTPGREVVVRQNAALDDRMAEIDEDILRLVRAAEPEPRKELVF